MNEMNEEGGLQVNRNEGGDGRAAARPANNGERVVQLRQPVVVAQAAPLPRLPPSSTRLGIDDPRRMDLTPQEIQWAHQIKDAIQRDPEIEDLSDFKYAQLALIEQDNIENAKERAYQMQMFREEYGVQDCLPEGKRCLNSMMEQFPKFLLSFSFEEASTGSYVLVYSFKGLITKELSTPRKLQSWICGCYYVMHSFCPDFDSIRKGVVTIAECEGYDWSRCFDIKTYHKFWSELGVVYPVFFRLMKYFHCGVFTNLLHSMTKKLMTTQITSRIDWGCKFDGKIDEIYLTPTVEAANERLLTRMGASLKKRYDHERTFNLPPLPAS